MDEKTAWVNAILDEFERDPDANHFVFDVLRGVYPVPDGGFFGLMGATFGTAETIKEAVEIVQRIYNQLSSDEAH